MLAISLQRTGGADALEPLELPDPAPGPGEVLVAVERAGVNFIDVYHRSGLYPIDLPAVLGVEGAGVVVAHGPASPGSPPPPPLGARVAWAMPLGSYATLARVPADRLVPIPEGLSSELAAAALLQGLTAHYLVHDCLPPPRTANGPRRALVHAAAGGVGLLLVQWLRELGVHVLGVVSNGDKAELAREAGADQVVLAGEVDLAEAAREFGAGRGVDVVYDSVGDATLRASLASLAPRGLLVSFGQSSGTPPPIALKELAGRSLTVMRPTLGDYVAERPELEGRAADLFTRLAENRLKVRIERVLPLAEAAIAHRLLESRATAGKLLLAP